MKKAKILNNFAILHMRLLEELIFFSKLENWKKMLL